MRMHFFFKPIGPALLLLGATANPAGAGTAAGTLQVSMTVLATCAAGIEAAYSLNSGSPGAVSVQCPPGYPFRSSLARGRTTGIMGPADPAGLQVTGRQRMSISQPDAGHDQPAPAGPIMLSIAY